MEGEDRKEKPPRMFFSRIKQQVEPLEYFLRLLGLLLKYASLIDSCEKSKREIVWHHIINLYNLNVPPTADLFAPVVAVWRNSLLMDLEAIEMYYLGFSNALLEHPNLLESDSLPFPVPNKSMRIPDGFKSIWGSGIVAQLQQLSLVMNWAPRLDKLAPKHKEAIWLQCEMFPMFTPDEFDRSSFRHTIATWAEAPVRSLRLASILFSVIGYLSDCAVIKALNLNYRFCYPDTLTSVFGNQPSKAKYNKTEFVMVIRHGVSAVPHPVSSLLSFPADVATQTTTTTSSQPPALAPAAAIASASGSGSVSLRLSASSAKDL